MKVLYTDEALRDLDEILEFIELNYPTITAAFERRVRAIERRIAKWPKSAAEVDSVRAFASFRSFNIRTSFFTALPPM